MVSCRGWSSDAHWAARAVHELERAGHQAIFCGRAGTEERVLRRARGLGVKRIETLALTRGLRPAADTRDVTRLVRWLPEVDVVHVHRGKEHWLAALANRVSRSPRPLVRTRHIVRVVRPHAANRWLYGAATDLVITVTHAIARQYVASGLLTPERAVTLPGGVDDRRFRPGADDRPVRAALGLRPDEPLLGIAGGLRVMKGHQVVVEALARLGATGVRPHVLVVGEGSQKTLIREGIRRAGLDAQFSFVGFAPDLPQVVGAIDVALYVPLESDGMGRVVFEYLATARALIASRVGIVPEVLTDGRDALLVPAGDPGALAAAIGRLLEDERLRQALGVAGRRLVEERYSGARVAQSLVAHYARLVRLPGP